MAVVKKKAVDIDNTHSAPVHDDMSLARCARGPWDWVELFGVTMNSMTLEEFLEAVDQQIARNEPGYTVTPNVDHVCLLQKDKALQQVYHEAHYVLPDGVPLMWAGKLCRKPMKQKLSGSDLVYWLTEHAAQKGYSIFFLGAAEGIAEKAAQKLQELYPGFKIAGHYSPPLGFEKDPVESHKICDMIKAVAPDICYVALGTPKQEYWNGRHCEQIGVPCLIGIGASFDFVTGKSKRAPKWMQCSGLEWIWRLTLEPTRLGKRYAKDLIFIPMFCREFIECHISKAK